MRKKQIDQAEKTSKTETTKVYGNDGKILKRTLSIMVLVGLTGSSYFAIRYLQKNHFKSQTPRNVSEPQYSDSGRMSLTAYEGGSSNPNTDQSSSPQGNTWTNPTNQNMNSSPATLPGTNNTPGTGTTPNTNTPCDNAGTGTGMGTGSGMTNQYNLNPGLNPHQGTTPSNINPNPYRGTNPNPSTP